MAYREIPHRAAEKFCRAVFTSYGFSPGESGRITDVLLRADLYGVESHGIQRLVRYHHEIHSGMVDVSAVPEIVCETPVSAVIDARKAMGQLVATQAMEAAIGKAAATGIGMVAVRNANHFGIAGYYSMLAAEQDLLGICMCNTEAICVPTFGKRAMLGTNPVAVAMPADPIPFSFDAATTVVPRGKLEVYNKNGRPLPDGWAVDSQGKPTGDAGEVLSNIIGKLGGGIAPLGGSGELHGGHKGYGFAAIVDLFTGVLSGGVTSNHVSIREEQSDICHFFTAIDYGIFGEREGIRRRFSTFLQELRDSDRSEGAERIYTHGQKELECRRQREDGYLPVNDRTWSELRRIAAEQKLPFEAFFHGRGSAE